MIGNILPMVLLPMLCYDASNNLKGETVFIAAIVMAVFEFLIQKKDMKVLENFSLAASMLIAMAAAVVVNLGL